MSKTKYMEDNKPQGRIDGQLEEPPEEKNKYILFNCRREADDTLKFQEITFYKMNPDKTFENGTTIEEMLRISILRLKDLNSKFSCRENSIAITKMQEAIFWLNERTNERIERGVEGEHQK